MKSFFILLINIYQGLFSPQTGFLKFLYASPLLMLSGGGFKGCRFHPTCSEYLKQSLKRYSLLMAINLFFKRIGRCHGLGDGGVDVVPSLKQ